MEKGYPLGEKIPREGKLGWFHLISRMWILKTIRLQPVTIQGSFFPLKTLKPGDEFQALQNCLHQKAQLLPCVLLWRLGDEAGHDDYSVPSSGFVSNRLRVAVILSGGPAPSACQGKGA